MKTTAVKFSNQNGEELQGRLEAPENETPLAYAIFAHCFTCTKDIKAASYISKELARRRIATLRFDFTGLGDSCGIFADSTFLTNTQDIISAGEFLAKEYEGPRILVGHSLGGAAVLHAAKSIESVKAVATVGAPFDPEHVTHHLQSSIKEIEEKGEAEVLLSGRPFTLKKAFLDDLKKLCPSKTVSEMGKALLILHSPTDQTVGIENAEKLYDAARHPKSFVTLDSADHLLRKKKDAEYVGGLIAAWSERYL